MILKILTLFFICFCGAPTTSISSVKSEEFKPNIQSPVITESNDIVKSDTSTQLNTQSKINTVIQSNDIGKSEDLNTPEDLLPSPPPNTSPSIAITKSPTLPTIDFSWESEFQQALGEETCKDSSSVPPQKQCYTLIKYCVSCHNWATRMSELTKQKDDILGRLTNKQNSASSQSPSPQAIAGLNQFLQIYQNIYKGTDFIVTPDYNKFTLTISSRPNAPPGTAVIGSGVIDFSQQLKGSILKSPMPKNRWQIFYDSSEGKDLIKWFEGLPK